MIPLPTSICQHGEARATNDNWTDIKDRKERKKVQNRMNQRAHRMRISEEAAQKSPTRRRPYQVDRWRLEQYNALQPDDTRSDLTNENEISNSPGQALSRVHCSLQRSGNVRQDSNLAVISLISSQSHGTLPSLLSDRLLHLVHYNVFRALISNKNFLRQLSEIVIEDSGIDNLHPSRRLCGRHTVIRPANPQIPTSLLPTSLQMVRPHSKWIDMFPFPQIRDNLIRWEGYFDHVEFLRDIFGSMVNDNLHPTPDASEMPTPMVTHGEDDVITTGRKGLVVWGEAYNKDSWEATPGFLRKWAWVVENCEELIEISNRWRKIRGEEPIQASVTSAGP
ncbi:hypothetical protein N7448_011070 [Penicillium atrosanguineum]|nr:hypothetical protein N7448_011070 [Penicillium atrosanguineum]